MENSEDKIIQIYREKGEEFRIPLRDGGWERLEAALDAAPARRRLVLRWVAAVVAAAALVSLLLLIDMGEELPEAPRPVAVERAPDAFQPPADEKERPATHLIVAAAKPRAAKPAEVAKPNEPAAEADELPAEVGEFQAEASEFQAEASEREAEADEPEAKPFIGPEREAGNKSEPLLPPVKTRGKQGWSIALSAGSNAKGLSLDWFGDEVYDNNVNAPSPPGQEPNPEPGDGEDGGEDNEDEGRLPRVWAQAPQLRDEWVDFSSVRYHHRLPVSVGLSVQRKMSDAFAVGTGLTYTYLRSDISRDGAPAYIGRQEIYYLGVPFRADWQFYRRGALTVYLSGGALLEYAVSAGVKIGGESYSVEMNRFQASANVSPGLQITLMAPFSLFVEPGISYYFGTGSTVETLRSENPLMFNLQAGVRFTY